MRDYKSNLSTTVKIKGNMPGVCFQTNTSKIVKSMAVIYRKVKKVLKIL